MDLSIIIPIYNTPLNLLKRCFNSICLSKEIAYEVILIDDGSKEYIEKFCREYILKNKHFKYFKQNNSGVSVARNLGILNATGKYITFLDSDDELLFQEISKEIFSCNCNIVLLDAIVEVKNKEEIWRGIEDKEGTINIIKIIEKLVNSYKLYAPWGKLYNLNNIKKYNIKFDPLRKNGEDLNFTCDMLLINNSVYYKAIKSYKYYFEKDNEKKRIQKYPDLTLNNTIYLLDKVEELIHKEAKDIEWKNYYLRRLNYRKINNLFLITGYLQRANLLDNENKEKIIKEINNIINKNKNLNISSENLNRKLIFKTNINTFLLKNECWKLVGKVSQLREIYQNIK